MEKNATQRKGERRKTRLMYRGGLSKLFTSQQQYAIFASPSSLLPNVISVAFCSAVSNAVAADAAVLRLLGGDGAVLPLLLLLLLLPHGQPVLCKRDGGI